MATPIKLDFDGASGARLSGRLDLPAGTPKAFALFAHCFTCSKDLATSRTIASALTREGIAVLRFDFTGLGGSGGDFGSSNFTMNLGDLRAAAAFLDTNYEAPALLVGHSLGGAAVIATAGDLSSVKAVATIGAPSDTTHVAEQFSGKLAEIRDKGAAEVDLAGRPFWIERQFLDDLEEHDVTASAGALKKPLLILHAPRDETVGIENATRLFTAAKHPKSFVSLGDADHLLTDRQDANYAASVIAAWAGRYLDLSAERSEGADRDGAVEVRETGQGKFQALVKAGPHLLLADEPTSVPGGLGTGPSPYEYLSAALGSCTSMTLRMYAEHKGLALDRVTVDVRHDKVHAKSAKEAEAGEPKVDRFTREILLEGDLTKDERKRLIEIADRCPVHRTLERGAAVRTKEEMADD